MTFRKTYWKDDVKASGMPYHNGNRWINEDKLVDGQILLPIVRCRTLKVPYEEHEVIVAYRRDQVGYIPLYDRTGRVDEDKLFPKEIIKKEGV